MPYTDTATPCAACGGLVDHRSRIVRKTGDRALRECIHCGHIQPCDETKVGKENWKYLVFLDKLTASRLVDLDDGVRAKWLRERIASQGYVQESQRGEFRRLERKYSTQI